MSLTELEPALRANLNFPIEKYYPVILVFSFGLFSHFHSLDSPYPIHKKQKNIFERNFQT